MIVSWGSTKGPVLDAIDLLASQGIDASFLQLTHIWPFPAQQVSAVLAKAKRIILIENNATAQLGSLISQACCINISERILRYDGRPFTAQEICDAVVGGR